MTTKSTAVARPDLLYGPPFVLSKLFHRYASVINNFETFDIVVIIEKLFMCFLLFFLLFLVN